MTVAEAAQILLDRINQRDFPSMLDLARALGKEGEGEYMWVFAAPNVILWANMSNLFIDAMQSLRPQIEPRPTSLLTYLADGGTLQLPLARKVNAKGYKKPHWLPVTWIPRVTPLPGQAKSTGRKAKQTI